MDPRKSDPKKSELSWISSASAKHNRFTATSRIGSRFAAAGIDGIADWQPHAAVAYRIKKLGRSPALFSGWGQTQAELWLNLSLWTFGSLVSSLPTLCLSETSCRLLTANLGAIRLKSCQSHL